MSEGVRLSAYYTVFCTFNNQSPNNPNNSTRNRRIEFLKFYYKKILLKIFTKNLHKATGSPIDRNILPL